MKIDDLNKEQQFESKNLINKIFDIIGFDVIKNRDNSFIVIDLCNDDNSFECADKVIIYNGVRLFIQISIKINGDAFFYASWDEIIVKNTFKISSRSDFADILIKISIPISQALIIF